MLHPALTGPAADFWTKGERWIDLLSLPRLLILLALVSFVLRIFYTGYLFEDDGLWFTAAEQILRGKALYREIYFDKPPVLPLVYALLFKVFGAHILVIRLFTVVLVTAVSGVIYLFGSSLYDRRTGALSAALFTFFSTTGVSGHVQGLNTDFLMVLPYTLGAYLLTGSGQRTSVSGRPRSIGRQSCVAVAGGALTGIAMQTNPKGIFNLAFFCLLLMAEFLVGLDRAARDRMDRLRPGMAIILLVLGLGGLLAGSLPFMAYLAATHSVGDYIRYVWLWGFEYARYFRVSQSLSTGARVILSYLALNSLLGAALAAFLWRTANGVVRRKSDHRTQAEEDHETRASPSAAAGASSEPAKSRLSSKMAAGAPTSVAALAQSRSDNSDEGQKQPGGESMAPDLILFIWLACSFAGMAMGGRFYTHYVFEILPALCLVGARGLVYIKRWAELNPGSERHRYAVRLVVAVLAAGFLVTVGRFHARTAVLAMDWVRGSKSESTSRWFHEVRNREERMAAGIVSEMPGGAEEAIQQPPEAIRSLRQATRRTQAIGSAPGPSDYLFVWGYRPEVYYWSGLIPASRFISIQPVTGIPADVQYVNGNSRSVLPDSVRQSALYQLLSDLEETKPKYVVDEAGMFNSALDINSYPGMAEFMRSYKQIGPAGRLMVYRRRDPSRKRLRSGQPVDSGRPP